MKVLVDTPVWSLAFRKKQIDSQNNIIIKNLVDLIHAGRVAIIGAVRQEVLSGISDNDKYHKLKNALSMFTDYDTRTNDYEYAAECSNECRRNGVQGSHTDFLICAIAIKNGWEIFTEDTDFLEYKRYLPVRTYILK